MCQTLYVKQIAYVVEKGIIAYVVEKGTKFAYVVEKGVKLEYKTKSWHIVHEGCREKGMQDQEE